MNTYVTTNEPVPTCPCCGTAVKERIRYPGSDSQTRRIRFDNIGLCNTCGCGIALPWQPQESLDELYSSGEYWSEAVGFDPRQRVHEGCQAKLRLNWACQHLHSTAPLTVLDVGAGHGYINSHLGALAHRRPIRYDFIEPDDLLSEEIGRRTNAHRLASLEEATPGIYDVIFVNHVVEHVADPPAVLRTLARLVRNDGVLYIETPNEDFRFKKDCFPHTWFFSKRSAQLIAERNGLQVLDLRSFGRWPYTDAPHVRLWIRSLLSISKISSRLDIPIVNEWLDRSIWRYDAEGNGIWLRWILRPNTNEQPKGGVKVN